MSLSEAALPKYTISVDPNMLPYTVHEDFMLKVVFDHFTEALKSEGVVTAVYVGKSMVEPFIYDVEIFMLHGGDKLKYKLVTNIDFDEYTLWKVL